jgi:hypothetical protein
MTYERLEPKLVVVALNPVDHVSAVRRAKRSGAFPVDLHVSIA